MTLKQVYTIYNTLMKLHRKYVSDVGRDRISEFASEVNALNSEMNHPLCNDLTHVFYGWYRYNSFMLDDDAIKAVYSSVWTAHRTLLGKKREMGDSAEFWHLAERTCVGATIIWTGVAAEKIKMFEKVIWDSLERDDITIE